MAKRPTLSDITTGHGTTTKINANFDAIEQAFDNTLSRDGSSPNAMEADLDMNSNQILNLPDATTDREPLTYGQYIAGGASAVVNGFRKETQTATSGQTVFTATFVEWVPGIDNLMVFVNGELQGLGLYTVDSSTQITFTSGLTLADRVDFVVMQIATTQINSTIDAGLVSYKPFGTTNVTNVESKLRETVSVKDFGAVGDGVTDDSAAVVAAFAAHDVVCITSPTAINTNISIGHDKTIVFSNGWLVVGAGRTVTVDALIDAPEEWIFRGAGSVVATNRYNNGYPDTSYNRNSRVFAKWFGVLNDAVYNTFYSPSGIPSGSWTFGTPPTSYTDSTEAMKAALLYCQLAQNKGASADYATSGPELILPSGVIYVEGNNPFGSQIFRTELEAAYAAASGGSLPTLSSEIQYSAHQIIITGQETTVLWKPTLAGDKFSWAFHTCQRTVHKNYHMHYIVPEGPAMGVAFYNISYGLRGTTSGHSNSLREIYLHRVKVHGSGNGGRSQLTSFPLTAIDKILFLEGYSVADHVTVEDCDFRGFVTGVCNANPEAVLQNYINTWWSPSRIQSPNTVIVFDYQAFSGGFRAEGNYFDFKQSNVTLLRTVYKTDLYIGNSIFASANRFHFGFGNRIEGLNSETNARLYDGYSGTAIFESLSVAFGGSHTASFDAVLTNTARAVFKEGTYYGDYSLDAANMPESLEPSVTYENCTFTLSNPVTAGGYPSSNYFVAATQSTLNYVPTVKLVNQGRPPYPEYFGPQTYQTGILTEGFLGDRIQTGGGLSYYYIGQPPSRPVKASYTLSGFIVIQELLLNLSSHSTATYDGIRLTFTNSAGSYALNFALSGAEQKNTDIMPSGKWISTSSGSNVTVKIELTLSGIVVAGATHPGRIIMKYRPIQSGLDVVDLVTPAPHEINTHIFGAP